MKLFIPNIEDRYNTYFNQNNEYFKGFYDIKKILLVKTLQKLFISI